jgi:hypothetical protein
MRAQDPPAGFSFSLFIVNSCRRCCMLKVVLVLPPSYIDTGRPDTIHYPCNESSSVICEPSLSTLPTPIRSSHKHKRAYCVLPPETLLSETRTRRAQYSARQANHGTWRTEWPVSARGESNADAQRPKETWFGRHRPPPPANRGFSKPQKLLLARRSASAYRDQARNLVARPGAFPAGQAN